MKPTVKYAIVIGSVVILVLIAVVIFLTTSVNKLQRSIDVKSGEVLQLQEQLATLKKDILKKDSILKVRNETLVELKRQNADLVHTSQEITSLYEKEKNKVSKFSSAQSVAYFKTKTIDFPSFIVKTQPDTSYEVPAPAIKVANNKFVQLEEEQKVNTNLRGINTNLTSQIATLESISTIKDEKIATLNSMIDNQAKQNSLLQQNIRDYEKIVKKEKRRKTTYKITTTVAAIGAVLLLIIK